MTKAVKKIWKIFKYLAITFACVLLADLAVVEFYAHYRPAINQKVDAVVILGAAINTPALYNRSLEGLRVYQEGKAGELVLSGGRISDKDLSEAGYMQKTILANTEGSVPKMIIEDQSHTTYENLVNSRDKIGSGKSIIIVSDDFHLARAVLLAKRLGFNQVYWSSPPPVYYSNSELAYYYMREVFAILDYAPKYVFGK